MVIVEEGDSAYSLSKMLPRDEINSSELFLKWGGGSWLAASHEGRGIQGLEEWEGL